MTESSGRSVLLVSPYHSGSHAQWASGYAAASRHRVHIVSHEGQFWKWRLSGSAPTLAEAVVDHIAEHGAPDAILATSMTDVAGLLGLVRRQVDAPCGLYLHENQITYPTSGRTTTEQRLGLIAWTSLLAADRVAFNSAFHRDSLFAALPGFLNSFPDRRQHHLIESVAARSEVLPVGIDLRRLDSHRPDHGSPPLLVWNHRWDPDKAPEAFLDLCLDLAESVDYRVALAGERFVGQGDEYRPLIDRLGDRVVVDRFLTRDEYDRLLVTADIVVSTAHQEFFGVSVVEAMHAGAFPVLPDRLVYPERVPIELHDRALYRGPAHAVELLRAAVEDIEGTRRVAEGLRAITGRFDWGEVAPRYDDWIESMIGS
ncbi:MAG: DUF3524 domain-containing protein [Acidimicrobiia bacterium]